MSPGPPVGGTPGWKIVPDGENDEAKLVPLWRKQLPLLVIVAISLLVALGSSPWWGDFLLDALFWDAPFYVNPLITLSFFIYVALGLALTSGPGDQGWPIYLILVTVWIIWVSIEFSLILWFEIQVGIRTSANRVHLLSFAATAIAVGATILLHVNQLNRRLVLDLKERGIETAQLEALEPHAGGEARRIVVQLLGLVVAATFVLFLGDLIIGTTDLGIDVLGILAGLVIMSVLLVYSYNVLKKGPFLAGEDDTTTTAYARNDDEGESTGIPGMKRP